MPKILCNVETCHLNKNQCCCSGSINVAGDRAEDSEATCCETFRQQQPGFTNKTETVKDNSYIKCEASNCMHNSSGNCTAQTIKVQGGNAYNCGETCCATFDCCD